MTNLRYYTFDIDPVGKPRMTQRDKWKKRDCVTHYYAFKDELRLWANKFGLQTLPDSIEMLTFVVPMPQSWSEKKKIQHDKTPHRQKPDLDNMLKALQDCLCTDDKHIWQIKNLSKMWGRTGKILIEIEDIKT
jgi:Holliday junction resolvase RusA-like endonuclease